MKKVLIACMVWGWVALAYGQQYVRLQPVFVTDVISANGDSVVIEADRLGAFGTIKIQLLDSYSGTWEVQCSADGDTFDTASELKIAATDGTTSVYSVTDTVAIYDVLNAAGCRKVRVIATAGFAMTDTTVVLSATQLAGGGSSGGGGAGSSDTTETTQLAVLAAVDGLEANTDTLEANTDLLEGYTLAIAGYLVDIQTNTAATAVSVDAIADALAPESVQGNAVIATGPGIQGEAKAIDGGALPNVVTEGQSVRMAMTLSGSPIVTLSNVAGSADVGALILTALQIIDNAETAASHYTYTTDAMTEDEHVVCAAPCTLWSITATNHAATVAFLRCENQDEEGDGAPGTDTLAAATDIDIALPGNAAGAGISGMNFPRGMSFSVGLKCWVVTGEAYDNTDEVGANDVKLLYTYK